MGLGAGRNGRVVDARLIVVVSGVGDGLMSLTSKHGNSGGILVLPATSTVAFRSNIGISTRNVCTLHVQCLGRDSLFLVTL